MEQSAFLVLAVGAALLFMLVVALVAIDDALRDRRRDP